MKFADLKDDTARDLGKEVERLRIEVSMAQQGYLVPSDSMPPFAEGDGGDTEPMSLMAAGFQSPDDFTLRDQTLSYDNGDSYAGETLGSLRHGRGKHTCSSGDVYEGQWRYDKREGSGKLTLVRGVQYEGEWKEDKAHGEGVARYENGGVYVGSFENDVRSGWGSHYFPTRDKYEGEWRADTMHGKGHYSYADGSHFEGEWEQGTRVKGKMAAADGSYEYSGGWKGLQRQGYGVCYQRGLWQYMGQWEGDQQHGEGKCIYADGSQYDGQWQAGARHGRGKFSQGAARYEGEWRDGRQHGAGASHTEAGDKYVGEFVEGKRHGRGRCLYADGTKYEGEWQADMRHGTGTCIFAGGDKYAGEWRADKRHGQGVCKFADGRKFRGEWEDDAWVQSAADPAHCRVAGPGVTRAVAGQVADLVIEARDEGGCKRLSGGDEFQVSLWLASTPGTSEPAQGGAAGAAVTADVTDNGDGSYAVRYTALVAGVYELHITLGSGSDDHVAHSPYPLRILPAKPCLRRCQVEGPGRRSAVAGQPAHFTVAVHDEFGNRCVGDPRHLSQLLPLEGALTGGDGSEVAVQLEAARDGCFQGTYTVPCPGYWRLSIECCGQPLPGAPFSVQACDPTAVPAVACGAGAGATSAEGAAQASGNEAAAAGSQTHGDGSSSLDGTAGGGGDVSAPGRAASAAPGVPALAPPVRDQLRVWEQIAAAAFAAADGSMEGWDDDSAGQVKLETKEDKYIKSNPGVPVVESLEDLWKVSKLQAERKAKEEADKIKRLQSMRSQLEQAFGQAQVPDQAEVMAAVKQIVAADLATAAPNGGGSQQGPGTPAGEAAVGPRPVAAPAVAPRPAGRAGLRAAAAALAELD